MHCCSLPTVLSGLILNHICCSALLCCCICVFVLSSWVHLLNDPLFVLQFSVQLISAVSYCHCSCFCYGLFLQNDLSFVVRPWLWMPFIVCISLPTVLLGLFFMLFVLHFLDGVHLFVIVSQVNDPSFSAVDVRPFCHQQPLFALSCTSSLCSSSPQLVFHHGHFFNIATPSWSLMI